jgi:hypothetical protein
MTATDINAALFLRWPCPAVAAAPSAVAPSAAAATLTKMVKELLPQDMRCAADCMDMLMDCCTGEAGTAVAHIGRFGVLLGA